MQKDWVSLDNPSTAHMFCNSKHLKLMCTAKGGSHIDANGGVLKCNQQGTCQNAGDVWCHPDAVANMLSFSLVEGLCHTACDNECKDVLVAHKTSGETVGFANCGRGSHHMDPTLIRTTLVNTVREMRGHFTPQQCTRAMKACNL